MRGFFRELKDRRVYRVALAYGVVTPGLDARRGGDGDRGARPWRLLVLAPLAQSQPNEPSSAGKEHRGSAFRKPEHGKGKRFLRRRRAGPNSDRPGEGGRPESDRPHERAAIQGRPRTQSNKNR